jgi:hypothetical protein
MASTSMAAAVIVAYSEEVVLLPNRSEFGISRCEQEDVLSCANSELGRRVEVSDCDVDDAITMSSDTNSD